MGTWRIDDLAQHTGVSVDTIRFYQREHLLPPAEREGRHKVYGDEHVTRLARIRELQQRRFSLAAIRAFLEGEREGLLGMFSDDGDADGASYSLAELITAAGIGSELANELIGAGLLRKPTEVGHNAYDATDLDVLVACRELAEFGMPNAIVTELVRIYVEGVATMQGEVIGLFEGGDPDLWDAAEVEHFQNRMVAAAPSLFATVTRIVGYVHQRTLQRLTFRAIGATTGEAVGDGAQGAAPKR